MTDPARKLAHDMVTDRRKLKRALSFQRIDCPSCNKRVKANHAGAVIAQHGVDFPESIPAVICRRCLAKGYMRDKTTQLRADLRLRANPDRYRLRPDPNDPRGAHITQPKTNEPR